MSEIHLTVLRDVAELVVHNVPDNPGIAADIFGALGAKGVNVELVISSSGDQHKANIAFAVKDSDIAIAKASLNELKDTIKFDYVETNDEIAILTLSWHMLSGQPGSGGRLFRALSKYGVNIEAISTSLSSISCMVSETQIDTAEKALREEFGIE